MEVKHMVIVAITVGDRTRKNIGDLVGLKESIQAVGLLHPIVVNSAGELISGLRRMRAFQELGREEIPVCVAEELDDPALHFRAEHDENVCRLDMTDDEKVALAERILPFEREAARKRQGEAGKNYGSGKEKIASENVSEANSDDTPAPRQPDAVERTAAAVDMSAPTLRKKMKARGKNPNTKKKAKPRAKSKRTAKPSKPDPPSKLYPGIDKVLDPLIKRDHLEGDEKFLMSVATLSVSEQREYIEVYSKDKKDAEHWFTLPRWKRPIRVRTPGNDAVWRLFTSLRITFETTVNPYHVQKQTPASMGAQLTQLSGLLGALRDEKKGEDRAAKADLVFGIYGGMLHKGEDVGDILTKPWEKHSPNTKSAV